MKWPFVSRRKYEFLETKLADRTKCLNSQLKSQKKIYAQQLTGIAEQIMKIAKKKYVK